MILLFKQLKIRQKVFSWKCVYNGYKHNSVRSAYSDNLDVFRTAILEARTQPSKDMIHEIEIMNIFYLRIRKM